VMSAQNAASYSSPAGLAVPVDQLWFSSAEEMAHGGSAGPGPPRGATIHLKRRSAQGRWSSDPLSASPPLCGTTHPTHRRIQDPLHGLDIGQVHHPSRVGCRDVELPIAKSGAAVACRSCGVVSSVYARVPGCRISRSTRLRPNRMPPRASMAWMRWRAGATAQIASIGSTRAVSATALADGVRLTRSQKVDSGSPITAAAAQPLRCDDALPQTSRPAPRRVGLLSEDALANLKISFCALQLRILPAEPFQLLGHLLVNRSSRSPRSASSWRTHLRSVLMPIPRSRATSAIVRPL
jgi:hypothetical protein